MSAPIDRVEGTPYVVSSEWRPLEKEVRTTINDEAGAEVIVISFLGRRVMKIHWVLDEAEWEGELPSEPAWGEGFPSRAHAQAIGMLFASGYHDRGGRPEGSRPDAPACDGVSAKYESETVLECCAVHDKCFADNDCTWKSWVWTPAFRNSPCARCNLNAVACIAFARQGFDPGGDEPDYFCAECGCFYETEKDLRTRCRHTCGNNEIDHDLGEECDPPTPEPACQPTYCTASCKEVTRGPPRCGDECRDPGEECGEPGFLECLPQNTCDGTCRCVPWCGNGVVNQSRGEDCDPPLQHSASCEERRAGYCGADCKKVVDAAKCGDGCQDPSETCGEPGLSTCSPGWHCSDQCQCVKHCGNSIKEPEYGETCDPPLDRAPTCTELRSGYCGPLCNYEFPTPQCNNGCLETGEECDAPDGPCTGMFLRCVNCKCVSAQIVCGDGIADSPPEECGEPGLPSCLPGSVCQGCRCVAPDAGSDAGPSDAGPPDAGPPDAGPPDAGPPDAGPPDAGPSDAGASDAGPSDAGASDAGASDAGPPDAGTDAGPPDAGPCSMFNGGCSYALRFDGVDDVVGSTINQGQVPSLYFESYVKLLALGALMDLMHLPNGFSMMVQGDGSLSCTLYDQSGNPHTVVSSLTLALWTWYHAACTFDGNTQRLFLNGNLEGSAAWSGSVPVSGSFFVSGPAQPLAAEVDQVRVGVWDPRYIAPFTPPHDLWPGDFITDSIYLFDEGDGGVARDSAGTSDAVLGVNDAGAPDWVRSDRP